MKLARSERTGGTRPTHPRSLVRNRLLDQLDHVWDRGVALVVAPAGWGKTTLATQFAETQDAAVAWCRVAPDAIDVTRLAADLSASIDSVSPEPPGSDTGPGTGLRTVREKLEGFGRPLLLVIDDIHLLRQTAAEDALARLVENPPPQVAFLLASREEPHLNLGRARLDGRLVEIGTDDLRFRTWEVEQLYRDVLGARMLPEDLATLARRTEGWPACLQLFWIAAEGRSHLEQRAILSALGTRSRLVREYLTDNVLAVLTEDLRDFLMRTSVLHELTPARCESLLEVPGTSTSLEELERRTLLVSRVDGSGVYRCHEMLRSHLQEELVRTLGADAAQAWYRKAAALLEGESLTAEALEAYLRGGDQQRVRELLGERGAELASSSARWIEHLPPSLLDTDPWAMLTKARLLAGSGRLVEAVENFREAEAAFSTQDLREVARRERVSTESFGDPSWTAPPVHGNLEWPVLARIGIGHDPASVQKVTRMLSGPGARLVEALTSWLAGETERARELLDGLIALEQVPTSLHRIAVVALGLLDAIGNQPEGLGLRAVTEALDREGPSMLARIADLVRAMPQGDHENTVQLLVGACEAVDDRWGEALVHLLHGMADLVRATRNSDTAKTPPRSHAAQSFEDAAAAFHLLRAPAMASVALSLGALESSLAGRPDARSLTTAAQRSAVGSQCLLAQRIARRIAAAEHHLDADEVEALLANVSGLSQIGGQDGGTAAPVRSEATGVSVPGTGVRLFGVLQLDNRGQTLDISTLKPRERDVLTLLAISYPRAIHREEIVDTLWPGSKFEAGLRGLQVAVSSIRKAFELHGSFDGFAVERTDDSYRLVLPAGVTSDLAFLRDARTRCAEARRCGDAEEAQQILEAALSQIDTQMLTDLGPEEWVIKPREEASQEVVSASIELARLCLDSSDAPVALWATEKGLAADRYRDELWQLAIEAHNALGNRAAAKKTASQYKEVLDELGA